MEELRQCLYMVLWRVLEERWIEIQDDDFLDLCVALDPDWSPIVQREVVVGVVLTGQMRPLVGGETPIGGEPPIGPDNCGFLELGAP
jgi:hypothetical protein